MPDTPKIFASPYGWLPGQDTLRSRARTKCAAPSRDACRRRRSAHLIGMRPVEARRRWLHLLDARECVALLPYGMYTAASGRWCRMRRSASIFAAASPAADWRPRSSRSTSSVQPARGAASLTARGRLIHATPTVGLSEVYIEDGNGRLLRTAPAAAFCNASKYRRSQAKHIRRQSRSRLSNARPICGRSKASSYLRAVG